MKLSPRMQTIGICLSLILSITSLVLASSSREDDNLPTFASTDSFLHADKNGATISDRWKVDNSMMVNTDQTIYGHADFNGDE